MHYILYNPLSKKGKCIKSVEGIIRKYRSEGIEYQVHSLLELRENTVDFISKVNALDEVIIVGGDGTLHYLANEINGTRVNNNMYYYSAGTGNDFSRDFKEDRIALNDFLFDLPVCEIDGKKEFFLNCAGTGLDGEVCGIVNRGEKRKSGLVYFWTTIKIFFQFKRYNLVLDIDDRQYHFSNVIFATVMNGQYFGGGMKLAPGITRNDDELDVFVVHRMKIWRLILLFPLIFLGWHMRFKKHGIVHLKGKEIHYELDSPKMFEADGEIKENISRVSFYAKKEQMKTLSQ